jgi:hypothetical protein
LLGDGRIEIDCMRSIHPITLDRKNALFVGSERGGENWAVIASLIETCKLCDVDPQPISKIAQFVGFYGLIGSLLNTFGASPAGHRAGLRERENT